MTRYAYALFFAVMAGGAPAGLAAVTIDALSNNDPSWAPTASGCAGLVAGVLVFATILRSPDTAQRDP